MKLLCFLWTHRWTHCGTVRHCERCGERQYLEDGCWMIDEDDE